ncbi:MAG: D-glycero-beta-D-manno-heptose 1-phosphate adenylyltransferase [Deltaproteobacteria bacterium]|nr:D-glycero-beta-D-manno-heptose 1-phosphate adenylyltransferase [Deltaproteobacteria bacterium]
MKSKFKVIHELKETLGAIRKTGGKIVFTNGCFDILHVGHVRYLREAKALGDYLVIALNSDSSVRGLKGSKRPIVTQTERAEVLASLESVDFVTIFDESDPYHVINELKPDFLVKGGDWGEGEIIGSDIVKDNGGQVLRIPFVEGSSSTNIVEKIIERYCGA